MSWTEWTKCIQVMLKRETKYKRLQSGVYYTYGDYNDHILQTCTMLFHCCTHISTAPSLSPQCPEDRAEVLARLHRICLLIKERWSSRGLSVSAPQNDWRCCCCYYRINELTGARCALCSSAVPAPSSKSTFWAALKYTICSFFLKGTLVISMHSTYKTKILLMHKFDIQP